MTPHIDQRLILDRQRPTVRLYQRAKERSDSMRYLGVGLLGALLAVTVCMSGAAMAAQEFTRADAKAKIEQLIAAKIKEGGGAFKFKDDRTGAEGALEFGAGR